MSKHTIRILLAHARALAEELKEAREMPPWLKDPLLEQRNRFFEERDEARAEVARLSGERARVVAWLRSFEDYGVDSLADAIKRGEHEGGGGR